MFTMRPIVFLVMIVISCSLLAKEKIPFLSLLRQGDNGQAQALGQWFSSPENNSFSQTPTGRAILAYILFKNKWEVYALKELFRIPNPDLIHQEVKSLWHLTVSPQHFMWSSLPWSPSWTRFFSPKIQKVEKALKARSEFQMALELSLQNKEDASLKILDRLMKDRENSMDKGALALTQGRLFYQKGLWNQAITHYKEVSQNSDSWFVAQEEKAWSHAQLGHFQKTLAITQTLMTPYFMPYTGPETVFLNALSQMKICDYHGTSESINTFKDIFKKRARALMEIQQKGRNRGISLLLEKLKRGKVPLFSLDPKTAMLVPHDLMRDNVFLRYAQIERYLEQEVLLSENWHKKYMANKSFKQFKESLASSFHQAREKTLHLAKKRAKEGLEEIKQTLQKMHLLEAELIQQIAKKNRGKKSKGRG